jgi:hypothetical protein
MRRILIVCPNGKTQRLPTKLDRTKRTSQPMLAKATDADYLGWRNMMRLEALKPDGTK